MTLLLLCKWCIPRKEKRSELRKIFEDNGNIPENILHNDEYFTKVQPKNLMVYQTPKKNKFNGKNYETLNEFQNHFSNLATIRNMVIQTGCTRFGRWCNV